MRSICERAVWLARGRVQAVGTPEEVYAAYRNAAHVETERRALAVPDEVGRRRDELRYDEGRFGTFEVEVADARALPEVARPAGAAGTSPIVVEVELVPHVVVEDPIVGVSLRRAADGVKVVEVNTASDGVRPGTLSRATTVALWLDRLDVEAGTYEIEVGVYERDWSYIYDYRWRTTRLEVAAAGGTAFGPARRWVVAEPGTAARSAVAS